MKIVGEGSYFVRLAVSFLALATIALLLSSFIVYANFEVTTIRENKTISEQMLSQTVYGADQIWDWASMHAIELYNNGYVFNAMYSSAVSPIDEMHAQEVLASAMSSNPYVYSIYLYNESANRIFSTISAGYTPDAFFDQDIVKILKDPSRYRQYHFLPRRVDFTHYDKAYEEDVLSLIVTESLTGTRPLNGALVLNIKASAMKNLVESYVPAKDNFSMILDEEGRVVSHTNPGMFRKDLSRESYVEKVAAAAKPTGFFTDTIEGKDTLVTYAKSDKLKWSFIRLKPYAALVEKTYAMRNLIVILLLSAFLLIIVGSLWLSWRFYKPYTRVVERSNMLKRQNEANRDFLRRDFLKNLLSGGLASYDEVEEKFRELEVPLSTERLAVLLLRIDDFRRTFTLAQKDKEALELKHAVEAVSHELLSPLYPCQTVDMGSEDIAVLLTLGGETTGDAVEKIAHVIPLMRKTARDHGAAGMSAALARVDGGAAELPAAYRGAMDLSEYRLILGPEPLITEELVRANMNADYLYSDELETEIVNGLKLRNYPSVESKVNAFFATIGKAAYDDMLMSIDRLAYASLKAITLVAGTKKAYNYKSIKKTLELMNSIEEMHAWFLCFYRDFINEEVDNGENVKKRHVDRVLEIIPAHYGDPNLSSDWLAENLGLSSNYLREIFRERMGLPLSHYINELRCEKASEMLLETTLSIPEICDRIGLSNSNYFFTLFKKHRGLTPTQFRNRAREAASP